MSIFKQLAQQVLREFMQVPQEYSKLAPDDDAILTEICIEVAESNWQQLIEGVLDTDITIAGLQKALGDGDTDVATALLIVGENHIYTEVKRLLRAKSYRHEVDE